MAKGLIYFVSWEDDLHHVKIGYSTGLQKRFSDFLIANWRCLVVRKVLHAALGQEDELLLHRQFAAHRIAGEWFNLSPSIVRFLEKEGDGPTWKAKESIQLPRLQWDVIVDPSNAFALPAAPKKGIKRCRHYVLWLIDQCERDSTPVSPSLLQKHPLNGGRFRQQTIYNEMQALRDREMIVKNDGAYRLTLFGRVELDRFNNAMGRKY